MISIEGNQLLFVDTSPNYMYCTVLSATLSQCDKFNIMIAMKFLMEKTESMSQQLKLCLNRMQWCSTTYADLTSSF